MLNAPQRQAVLAAPGPLVIFAGAGSGKTRVITHRIAEFVGNYHIDPYRLMAVTFTNKAAAEMRARVSKLLPQGGGGMLVGTFHSLSARLLRRHYDEAGVDPRFVVYDDADQKAMVTRVLRDLKLDEKRFPPRLVQSIVGRMKNEMETPDTVSIGGFDEATLRDVIHKYQARMDAVKALDFGDLIYRFVRALESNPQFLHRLSHRFEAIFVDEFQDTNHAQSRMVRALASKHQNITVVGDDDQSIYKWRGADRRNILDFRLHFAGAQMIKLEQNYRSTSRILRCAQSVIARNIDREPKELFTQNPEGEHVSIMRCRDEREEAHFVGAIAGEMRNGAGLNEMAVLYHTHAQSRVLEEVLRSYKIPYRIVGGLRFFDRAEVKDLLCYLRLLLNPADDVSLLRVINVPARGIGKTSVEHLLDAAAMNSWSLETAVRARAAMDERGGARLAEFVALIDGLRAEMHTGLGLALLAERVLRASGYLEMLQKEDSAESDARSQNLQELVGAMVQFEEEPVAGEELDVAPDTVLARFLESVSLDTDNKKGELPEDCLTLMTVHAAKGLEFDTVIVAGMEDGLFPFRSADSERNSAEDVEEERRLAYVAFTRARQRLFLTFASTRYVFGNLKIGQPSEFLRDLSPNDVAWNGNTPSVQAPMRFGSDRVRAEVSDKSGWVSTALSKSPLLISESKTSRPKMMGSLQAGMRVSHVRYGIGVVEQIGEGVPARVAVNFESAGSKHILADFLSPA